MVNKVQFVNTLSESRLFRYCLHTLLFLLYDKHLGPQCGRSRQVLFRNLASHPCGVKASQKEKGPRHMAWYIGHQ